MSRTTEIDDTPDAFPEISEQTRDYHLSDAGIEHQMRKLSDEFENWRDCPRQAMPPCAPLSKAGHVVPAQAAAIRRAARRNRARQRAAAADR